MSDLTDLVSDWGDREWDIAEKYVKAMDEYPQVRKWVETARGENDFEHRFYRAVLSLHDGWLEVSA
jgi:hypothetical protein